MSVRHRESSSFVDEAVFLSVGVKAGEMAMTWLSWDASATSCLGSAASVREQPSVYLGLVWLPFGRDSRYEHAKVSARTFVSHVAFIVRLLADAKAGAKSNRQLHVSDP